MTPPLSSRGSVSDRRILTTKCLHYPSGTEITPAPGREGGVVDDRGRVYCGLRSRMIRLVLVPCCKLSTPQQWAVLVNS